MNALVIIPTYNERENIPPLVEALLKHDGIRVLVVDDQSPDGTGEVADAAAAQHRERVDVLHRTSLRGFGRSYIDGIKRAIREYGIDDPHRQSRLAAYRLVNPARF